MSIAGIARDESAQMGRGVEVTPPGFVRGTGLVGKRGKRCWKARDAR